MYVVTKIARFLSDKWKWGSRRALNCEFYQICENRVVVVVVFLAKMVLSCWKMELL